MSDDPKPDGAGWVAEIAKHLGSIFRHMLPGALVIAGARLAHREWFCWVKLESWQHLLLLAAISVVVGNAWFALNRYGLHQLFDYILYLSRSDGPARSKGAKFKYIDDLGKYVSKSLHIPETSDRARQHVEFRASTVLLLLTLGEASIVFGRFHGCDSIFSGHERWMYFGGFLSFAVGLGQMVITRRIDFYLVNPPPTNSPG
ncbi:MAG: hypothetical protein WAJ96_09910 [Candidatus Acidiferrum sp.]